MEPETWRFINTFAPWFAAIGSLAAVMASLYIAGRNDRIRLEVSASLMKTFGEGPQEEFLAVWVTNLGRRETTIKTFGWQIGYFKKKTLLQFPSNHPFSSKLPIKLHDGEEATYYIPLTGRDNWLADFKKHLGRFPLIQGYSVKVFVSPSVGKAFMARVRPDVRRAFVTGTLAKQKAPKTIR